MVVSSVSTAAVHALVLLNISEHTTRLAAQRKRGGCQQLLTCGALLGRQKDSVFELLHSFELIFDQPEGTSRREFNFSHYTARLEQMRQVFPECDFIGWYVVSSSTEATREICKLHQQILNINPSALLLVYNASSTSAGGSEAEGNSFALPVAVYETMAPNRVPEERLFRSSAGLEPESAEPEYYVEVVNSGGGALETGYVWASRLVPVKVTVETGEAERIAIEHVASVSVVTSDATASGAGAGSSDAGASVAQPADASRMAMFLSSQKNAVEMLHKDIRVLTSYVSDVIEEKAPFDAEVLQLVQRVLCNRPVVQNDELFDRAMSQEETNFQMVAYLSSITDAVSAVRNVSQRSNAALQSARSKHAPATNHGPGGGMFGMDMMPMMFGGGGYGRSRGFGHPFR
ncbi:hypothetical protein GQ54DRAFT_131231 [Martensiomyces pterosporus]|nr:hypothetical protein GQ54DRAFT_131231 [Martensiomyces pterosporus]